MPTKAFLHKKSLLDQFKDDYKSTGYIQSARAEHTWRNPLTRRKRTNKLNGWIKSFQGKKHVHKLARFNAMQNENLEEAMSLKGFLSNIGDKLVNKYGLDKNKVQNYLSSHTQEMQELLDDKEMSLKDKAEFVRDEIVGKDEAKKSERLFNKHELERIALSEGSKVSPYLVEIAHKILKDEYGWKASTIEEVADWLGDHKQAFEHAYGQALRSSDDDKANVRAGIEAALDEEEQGVMNAEIAMIGESKEPAEEKLGYEKGHKNSKGEDAPWVIRSHKDNRILASFATEDKAKEHMKRMKQYSKQESKNESLTQDEEFYWYKYWADRIRDRLARHPGESGLIDENCKMLRYSDVRQMWGVAEQAKELCDKYSRYLSFRGYTNRNGSPFVEISWSANDADALAKALGPKVESKDVTEHLHRIKQYSTQEAYVDNSATAQKDYVERVISAVQDYYGYSLFDAKNLVQRNAQKVKDWYMSGEVSDVEAARCLGGNCEPTKKESKDDATDLEEYTSCVLSDLVASFHYGEDGAKKLIEQYSDLIRDNYVDGDSYAYETARAIAKADGNKYAQEEAKKSEDKEVTEEDGKEALRKLSKRGELPYGNNMRTDGLSLSRIADEIRYDVATALDMAAEACEDAMLDYGYDRIYVAIADGKTPAEVAADIKGSKQTESTDDDLRSRMKKVGYDLLENGNLHSWEYNFIKECLDFSEFKKLEQYLIRKGWYNSPTESKKSEGIHLDFEDTIKVPEWLWKAYMLNDTTDLEEDEIEKLNDFREKYKDYHLDDKSEDPYFSSRNDFDELGGNVYDVDVYKMSDEPNEKKSESKNEALKDFPDGANYKFIFDFYRPATANIAEEVAKAENISYKRDGNSEIIIWVEEPQESSRFIDSLVTYGNEKTDAYLERHDIEKAFKYAFKNNAGYNDNKDAIDGVASEYAVKLIPGSHVDILGVYGELTDVVDFLEAVK